MTVTATLTRSCTIGGVQVQQKKTITGQSALVKEVLVPPAMPGTLSAWTSGSAFSVTVASGVANAAVTGSLVDIYWAGGQRRSCLVGTVVGQVIPVTVGQGTNMPDLPGTVVQICPTVNAVMQFVGKDMLAFALSAEEYGTIDVLSSVPASELSTGTFAAGAAVLDSGVVYTWFTDDGTPNPLAGATVASVNFSHNDIESSHIFRVEVLLNY